MRQVGLLPHERDARRFLAFLITQDIQATCHREGDAWELWVHDEDHLHQARQLLKEYEANPEDPRYQDAQRKATQKVQDAIAKREAASKNVQDVSSKWRANSGGGGMVGRNSPLVFALIVISLLVAVLTQLGSDRKSGAYRALTFAEQKTPTEMPPAFREISRGQIWRLITPCFLHFSTGHIVFNCLAIFMIGSQIEDRRGSYFFAILFVVSAVISNSLQAAFSGPLFGGLSGFVYALFGYMWVVVLTGNRERYNLSPGNIALCLGWLILCILRDIPGTRDAVSFLIPDGIANIVHVAGMFVGMAFGALASRK